jgi:hypothetical protein
MKKIALIVSIFALLAISSFADVIPPDSHFVTRTVMIANCNAYPEIRLVGYITGISFQGYKLDEIKENVALNKGYKFNTYKVYALKTSFVQNAGGVSAIDFTPIAAKLPALGIIDPGSYYIENTKPLATETYVYRIWGYDTAGKLIVYLSKSTITYNDGTPAKITEFDYNP